MTGKPCFLPSFELSAFMFLQSFLLWFQSCSLSGSFWPYQHFPLPVSPPPLLRWALSSQGPGLARGCEHGEGAGGSPGDPEEMSACGPHKGSLHSQLALTQVRQPLAIKCWRNCPFSFYSLVAWIFFFLFKSLFSTIFFWCVFNLNFKCQLFFSPS